MDHRKSFVSQERAMQVERELRLGRAVEAFRMFYPSVSAWSLAADNIAMGMVANRRHGYCQGVPSINALTLNTDTPYAVIVMDATEKPVVFEVPAGNVMGVINNWYFQEIGNVGLPGPDGGKGGKYLLVGPGYQGDLPKDGYYVIRATTNNFVAVIRAVPAPGHMAEAMELLAQTKTYPLGEANRTEMVDVSGKTMDITSVTREETIDYWKAIHEILNKEVLLAAFYMEYGRLAAVGIERGKPFPQDQETQTLLLEAAKIALEQMKVEAFSASRPDRLVWANRQWEWVGILNHTGCMAPNYMDLYARDRWFYQATLYTTKMFIRQAGVGSIYMLGTKDQHGKHLEGSKNYKLHVPGPVPAQQFWSMTIYNVENRSEVLTDQNKGALSSVIDKITANSDGSFDLYVGPRAPKGFEQQWIKTNQGEDWFTYFRLYGPGEAAFDGKWELGDWQQV